jgi:hypothetical protein
MRRSPRLYLGRAGGTGHLRTAAGRQQPGEQVLPRLWSWRPWPGSRHSRDHERRGDEACWPSWPNRRCCSPLDLAGTFAFALNGAITGLEAAKLDIIGMLTLGMVTALGGGILRDIVDLRRRFPAEPRGGRRKPPSPHRGRPAARRSPSPSRTLARACVMTLVDRRFPAERSSRSTAAASGIHEQLGAGLLVRSRQSRVRLEASRQPTG